MSVTLYLVRHGIAVNIGEQGVHKDEDRMLSEEGVEKTERMAGGLQHLAQGEIRRIVSSPYRRACQTAEILSHTLGGGLEVELVDELSSGEDVHQQLRWLRKQPPKSTLLVGHMPDLSLMASYLISGTDRAAMEFKKAGVARIAFGKDFTVGMGCLEWLLVPAVLRQINK